VYKSFLRTIVASHNFTRAGVTRYAQNTAWVFAGKFSNMAIGFFATLYIARSLGPTNYGELSYALSFIALFSFISSLGIDSVLYREIIKYPEHKNTLLGTAFRIKLFAGSITAVLTICTAFLLSPPDVSLLIIVILSSTFILHTFSIISHEFGAAVNNKPVSILSFFVTALVNILKITVIFFGNGVLYLALIIVAETIFYALGYIYLRYRYFGSVFKWHYDHSTAKRLLLDSWPFIFTSAFAVIYTRIDQVMLKNMIDASAVGVYDAAVRLSELWYFFPAIIVGSLFPAIINAKKTAHRQYRQRILSLIVLLLSLSTVVAIGVSFLATPIVLLVFGAEFAAAIPILQIYIWAFIPVTLGVIAQHYLLAENARVTLFLMTIVGMGVNVLGNLILIPQYQGTGAAVATLFSSTSIIIVVVTMYILKRFIAIMAVR
jgi:O-antigen/teichoic acid export membrane protein